MKSPRLKPDDLRAAVQRALGDPDLRAGARRVAADLAACGGPPVAADALVGLLEPAAVPARG